MTDLLLWVILTAASIAVGVAVYYGYLFATLGVVS